MGYDWWEVIYRRPMRTSYMCQLGRWVNMKSNDSLRSKHCTNHDRWIAKIKNIQRLVSQDFNYNPFVKLVPNPSHQSLVRYVKLRVVHVPGMPGTFSPPPRVSDPDMHHGTCTTHVPWCMPGSLTSGFLWCQWWGKRWSIYRYQI